MICKKSNLFNDVTSGDGEELFNSIVEGESVSVERILSFGNSSPEGFYYDQDYDELVFVLKGCALLEFKGKGQIKLSEGDYLTIKAHELHRVNRTETPTVWLAVNFKEHKS